MPTTEPLIAIVVTARLEPYEFVQQLTAEEQKALLHAICSESIVPIAEVRSICNASGYDEI